MTDNIAESYEWVEVARLDDLILGLGLEVEHGGKLYALFRDGDRVFALSGLCPHQKAHLALGSIDPARKTVTCPRRGCLRWRFDLETGASVAGLAVVCSVYPVDGHDGIVRVRLPA